jgi:hypothetical protein
VRRLSRALAFSSPIALVVLLAAPAEALVGHATGVVPSAMRKGRTCRATPDAAALDALFLASHLGGISGADYPRPVALPDGRVLWLFQDVFFGDDDDLRNDRFAHNAALVQRDGCFSQVRSGTALAPRSWLGGDRTTNLSHWFWPLDGDMGADGLLHVFVVEFRNPRGTGAALGATPVATWRADIRPGDLRVVSFRPATDPGGRLYGWAIADDDAHTYLYGHCYRQFVTTTWLASDPSCSPNTYLARVPLGRFDAAYEYWTGSGWSVDASAAVPVLSRGLQNPMSVERIGGRYVSVTKLDDWFGQDLVVDVADAPEGPWREASRQTLPTKCGTACNTYGAFLAPWTENGRLVVAYSNNAWDMRALAFPNARLYRPSVITVASPV